MVKILIIDDEEIIRRHLKKLLSLDHYITFEADDGETGLELFKKEKPEIVILDVKMPGMSGIDVLKQIKGIQPDSEVILVTGHGGIDAAIQALRIGAYDYITKPIDYDTLEISIKKALEKQQLEKKLFEEKKYNENIMRSMIDSLIVITPEGFIKKVNESALNLLGYKEEDLLDQHISKIISNKHFIEKELMPTIKNFKYVNDVAVNYIHQSGNNVPVNLSASSMETKYNKLEGIVIVAKEMTEIMTLISELEKSKETLEVKVKDRTSALKKLADDLENKNKQLVKMQDQLIHNEKMAALGEFTAGITHELKQPLNIMNMTFSLLLKQIIGEITKNEIQEKILSIKEELDRAGKIIDSLLSFSHKQKKETNYDYIDLNDLISSYVKNSAFIFNKKQIQINQDLCKQKTTVYANKDQLIQIMNNLVNNAIDALDEKVEQGKMKKFNKLIELMTWKENNYVCFSFSDNGIGIKKDVQNKIFDPFYTTKAVGKGTGLGLSIVYGIVKSLKGFISVEQSNLQTNQIKFLIKLPGE